ncbi:MAG: ribonuclease III [Hyphomicrobiaceae bacterium]
MARPRKYGELEEFLGYRFKDRKILKRALTHASVRSNRSGQEDNERLEFLGDRVLGLVISELLHISLPTVREGDLARRFNRLVCGAACAQVAREIDLGRHLILSESEATSGGREKDTILADAAEAVLGAVFLEAGYETARDVVRRIWHSHLSAIGTTTVDAKSALQEWAQGNGLSLPRYVEVSRSGPDHDPDFVAEVRIVGKDPATGTGSSKRLAQQSAATELLVREGVWPKKKKKK